jgi:tetratricopeptide (TPR) repeat protein
LGATLNATGRVFAKRELWSKASEFFQEAVEARQQAVEFAEQTGNASTHARRLLTSSQMNLGIVASRQGQTAEALKYYEDAQDSRRGLLAEDSTNSELRKDIGIGFYNMGKLAFTGEDPSVAEAHFNAAVAQLSQLLNGGNGEEGVVYPLVICLRLLGDLDLEYEGAKQSYLLAIGYLRPLVEREPDSKRYLQEQARIRMNLGQLEQDGGDLDSATANLRLAIEILARLVSMDSTIPSFRRSLGISQVALAKALISSEQNTDAEVYLNEAERILERLVAEADQPDDKKLLDETRSLLSSFRKED